MMSWKSLKNYVINLLLAICLLLILLPASIANHHGTRCRVDFENHKVALTKTLFKKRCKNLIDMTTMEKIIKKNTRVLKALGSDRPHHKQVPIEGAAYSIPFSFSTCQIPLELACCPVLKWCYPYKQNLKSITCGPVNVALSCLHEKKRCDKNPDLPECKQPSPQKEKCYVNPSLPECKSSSRPST